MFKGLTRKNSVSTCSMFMKACQQTATGTLSNTNVSLLDQCLYDGPEIGSTGLLRVKEITGWELR